MIKSSKNSKQKFENQFNAIVISRTANNRSKNLKRFSKKSENKTDRSEKELFKGGYKPQKGKPRKW